MSKGEGQKKGMKKGLTPRELTVLRLYAVGFTINQVADRIQRHPKLVQWALKRLRIKFKVATSRELIIRACTIGVVDPEQCRLLGYTREIQDAPSITPIENRGDTDHTLFIAEGQSTERHIDPDESAKIGRGKGPRPHPR
jgi:DNA-binding CsgD family transcriptional regulator